MVMKEKWEKPIILKKNNTISFLLIIMLFIIITYKNIISLLGPATSPTIFLGLCIKR